MRSARDVHERLSSASTSPTRRRRACLSEREREREIAPARTRSRLQTCIPRVIPFLYSDSPLLPHSALSAREHSLLLEGVISSRQKLRPQPPPQQNSDATESATAERELSPNRGSNRARVALRRVAEKRRRAQRTAAAPLGTAHSRARCCRVDALELAHRVGAVRS